MKVPTPINPQAFSTGVPQEGNDYASTANFTEGTEQLGKVVADYGAWRQEQDNKRELFDVSQLVTNEANNRQKDFESRMDSAAPGAPNFVPQVNNDYEAKDNQLIQGLKDQGYGRDAIQEASLRLGQLRSGFVAKAIDFESKANFAKVGSDAHSHAIVLSDYVRNNPDAIGTVLNEFQSSLSQLGINPIEQKALFEQDKDLIMGEARQGYTIQNPQKILELYGITPRTIPPVASTSVAGGDQPFNMDEYLKKLNPAEGTGRPVNPQTGIPMSSAFGKGQFLKGTWLQYYKRVHGDTGESDSAILAKRGNPDEVAPVLKNFTEDDVSKLTAAKQPVNDMTVYLSHFLGINDALKVLGAHADASVRSLVTPASIAANPGVFKKINSVQDLLAWASNKMGVQQIGNQGQTPALTASLPQPVPGRSYNVEDAIQELGMNADQAQTFVATGKDTRTVAGPTGAPAPGEVVEPTEMTTGPDGKTGIPIIDLSTGPERLQMLTLAKTIINNDAARATATLKIQHDNWYNGFLNDVQDGKAGQNEINAAQTSGQFSSFEERQKAQQVFDNKNKKEGDLTVWRTMLESGQKFNPFDDTSKRAADAGFSAAVEAAQAQHIQTTPIDIAMREWQRTGILPTQGALMIRGGLVSEDPTQVAAAASVASNMLKQNPNAFASIPGGEEVAKAAINYTHYIDDLGMDAQAAAAKVAQQNTPEFQAKVQADRPGRDAFETSLVGNEKTPGIDIQKTLNDAILGKPGWGSTLTFHAFDPTPGTMSNPTRAEAMQTFTELAMDNYDKTHDPVAAQAYAAKQMSRFYGVQGGQIIKYPATKAYPPIMGSQDYIYDQARQDIKSHTGLDVKNGDIILQPTASGSTAEAFRAGQAPPYELHYITHEGGQPVYHVLPNAVFVADVGQAQRDAAAKAHARELQIRANHEAEQSMLRARGGG